MGYLHNILLPYVHETCRNLQLSSIHPCLIIFDHFKAQLTPRLLDALEKNSILRVEVPANCTDCLQPLDLSLKKPIKDQMKQIFQLWYVSEVQKQTTF